MGFSIANRIHFLGTLPPQKTVAMCSLEAMDVLQQQHLMVMRALEMLAVFLWTARDMNQLSLIVILGK